MATPAESRPQVQFSEFLLDLRTGELWRDGEKVALPYQAFQILSVLLEHPGQLVTREELVKRLWASDVFVDFEGSLNKAIKRLREALNDSADEPRFIETLPRRGYRFIAPVEAVQASADEAASLVGRRVSHYRVLEVIGGGGMGLVYKAEDLKLGRQVALKFLPQEWATDPAALQRFEREARTASSLNDPNICTIYEVAEHEATPFIVMELLVGETVRDRLARSDHEHSGLPLHELLDIGIQTCAGLQAAHDKGIVHRDIKPANIFLTDSGQLKILDFGLAKLIVAVEKQHAGGVILSESHSDESKDLYNRQDLHGIGVPRLATQGRDRSLGMTQGKDPTVAPGGAPLRDTGLADSTLTRTGATMGTAGYMSPEQVRGEKLDARTDIFSFGLVLYEMATGQRTFAGETAAVVHYAILNNSPVPMRELNSQLSPKLEGIIDRALEKDREQRYQTCAALGADLRSLQQPTSIRWRTPRLMLIGVTAAVLCIFVFFLVRSRLQEPEPEKEIVQRQLTGNTSDNPVLCAAISRDGKYLAFTDRSGISIQEIENGNTNKLAGTEGLSVADWFPDGLRLLVVDDKGDLWTLFMVSGEKHKLASRVFNPVLSPDGSQIAFLRDEMGRELWTMPAGGGDPQVRFAVGEHDCCLPAAWSPDGKSVAYIRAGRTVNDPATLETRSLEEGQPRVLLTDPNLSVGGDNVLRWLADGRIVFGRTHYANLLESDLWAIAFDPSWVGQPVRLTNTTGMYVEWLSASADGKRLACVFARQSFPIFVANLNKSSGRLERPYRFTNDSWDNVPAVWAPDSKMLFYESRRERQGDSTSGVYKQRLSSDLAELFFSGADKYSMEGLSGNGKWALVMANRMVPDKWRLLRVPVSGGAPEAVLVPRGLARVRCAIAGSRICVLSEDIDKKRVFSVVDPVLGRLQELARVDVREEPRNPRWDLSPDGSKIALVENLTDTVRVLDLQSNQVQVIHPMPSQPGLQYPAWSADGKRLFVSANPDEKGRLLEMDLEGHTHLLLENKPSAWIGFPLPSPDGKLLAYAYGVYESNVTLLEHF
jgi:eukaryotic-like serine/threonine-protein kinase